MAQTYTAFELLAEILKGTQGFPENAEENEAVLRDRIGQKYTRDWTFLQHHRFTPTPDFTDAYRRMIIEQTGNYNILTHEAPLPMGDAAYGGAILELWIACMLYRLRITIKVGDKYICFAHPEAARGTLVEYTGEAQEFLHTATFSEYFPIANRKRKTKELTGKQFRILEKHTAQDLCPFVTYVIDSTDRDLLDAQTFQFAEGGNAVAIDKVVKAASQGNQRAIDLIRRMQVIYNSFWPERRKRMYSAIESIPARDKRRDTKEYRFAVERLRLMKTANERRTLLQMKVNVQEQFDELKKLAQKLRDLDGEMSEFAFAQRLRLLPEGELRMYWIAKQFKDGVAYFQSTGQQGLTVPGMTPEPSAAVRAAPDEDANFIDDPRFSAIQKYKNELATYHKQTEQKQKKPPEMGKIGLATVTPIQGRSGPLVRAREALRRIGITEDILDDEEDTTVYVLSADPNVILGEHTRMNTMGKIISTNVREGYDNDTSGNAVKRTGTSERLPPGRIRIFGALSLTTQEDRDFDEGGVARPARPSPSEGRPARAGAGAGAAPCCGGGGGYCQICGGAGARAMIRSDSDLARKLQQAEYDDRVGGAAAAAAAGPSEGGAAAAAVKLFEPELQELVNKFMSSPVPNLSIGQMKQYQKLRDKIQRLQAGGSGRLTPQDRSFLNASVEPVEKRKTYKESEEEQKRAAIELEGARSRKQAVVLDAVGQGLGLITLGTPQETPATTRRAVAPPSEVTPTKRRRMAPPNEERGDGGSKFGRLRFVREYMRRKNVPAKYAVAKYTLAMAKMKSLPFK